MRKPWRESIQFARPPRSFALARPPLSADLEEHIRERERTSYETGRRDGERSLSEQLLQQRSELLEIQSGVLKSLRNTLPTVARECEDTLVNLALEIARKLVDAIPVTAETVEAAIREAVSQLEDTVDYTVVLNPDDFALLERVNSPALTATAAGEKVRIHSASEVSRGGCLVRTRFGVIDARRETRFELLKKSLLP